MVLQYLDVQQHVPLFQSHLRRNPYRKQEKAVKVNFYLRHNFYEKRIWPRFSASQDLERSLTKTKKELRQSLTAIIGIKFILTIYAGINRE